MKTVCSVLRSGGEYNSEDVARLRDGISQHLPRVRFVCFSDVPVPCEHMPLRQNWPGWWSKMELFDPSIPGDWLYFDLDTMFVDDLSDIAAVDDLTIMRDVYRPHGLQSSMMNIPQSAKAEIWNAFRANPAGHMERCTTSDCWGDQGFLEGFWLEKAARWQDVCPGRVVSYKVHGVTPDAAVVIFHGRPKPRDIGWKLT